MLLVIIEFSIILSKSHVIREQENTILVSIRMLVVAAPNNERKNYEKTDDRIRKLANNFIIVSHQDYFKIGGSVFKF